MTAAELRTRIQAARGDADATAAVYRETRDRYFALAERADEAFYRYFVKRQNGERTNAAQASRLSNETNYASADLATAEGALWAIDIDPREIDRADGVEREDYSS